MKKYIPYLIVIFVFLVLLAYSVFKPSPVVKNQAVLDEITRLEILGQINATGGVALQTEDLAEIEHLVKDDRVAKEYIDELQLLVDQGEKEHVVHSLGFLRDYVETGKEMPCLPHELWHISLFIELHQMSFVEQKIPALRKEYPLWEQSVDRKRLQYPQYYTTLDTLKAQIQNSIGRLEQKDYGNTTIQELKNIGERGLC